MSSPRISGHRISGHRVLERWVGVALLGVGSVATLWLAATGKLSLYVHPRYTVLSVVMAVIALGAVVAVVVVGPGGSSANHDHDHDQDGAGDEDGTGRTRPSSLTRLLSASWVTILIVAAFALLVTPPATLTASTRQNRDLVTSGQALDGADTTVLAGADPSTFTVKDWAALLRQGGPAAVLGQDADVVGYVLDDGDADVFYLVRMQVSCCAVDAQPIGVPVYQQDWAQAVKPGAWVALKGTFVENTESGTDDPVVVRPTTLAGISEPDQPYVF